MRRLLGRAGWSVLDQALSAVSNVLLAVMVARSVDATSFGAFGIVFLIFGIAVALTRSLVGQPLQIRFSSATEESFRRAVAQSSGCAVLLGALATLVCVAAGSLLPGVLGRAMLVFAIIIPGLLIQDTSRMAFFAMGRARNAALIDGVWAVGQVVLLLALSRSGQSSVEWLILAWGTAGAVSAGLGLVLLRVAPAVTKSVAWLREHRSLGGYLFADYVFGLGVFQVAILLVGILASAITVGALRATQVLLGPLGVLGMAAIQFGVPEVARQRDLHPRRVLMLGRLLSGVLGVVTAGYVLVILFLPPWVGREMFGESWTAAAPVLLPMGLSSFASALATGPAVLLLATGQARKTLTINLFKAPILIFSVALGTGTWGASGTAWALAITEAIVLPVWVITSRRSILRLNETADNPDVSDALPTERLS